MRRIHFRTFSLTIALALVFARPAAAQTFTWTGANTLGWNTTSNWSPGGIPNSPTALVNFTGNGPFYGVNISSIVSAQTLTFSNPTLGYTLTSNPGVYLNNVSSINVAAGVTATQTINLANIPTTGSLIFPSGNFLSITNSSTAAGTTLAIGSSTVIGTPGFGGVIFSGAGTTNVSGSFATPGSGFAVTGGLYMNGPGTLILSNPTNPYTGGTFVNAGTLMLGSGTAIPTGSNVSVSGGQFNISNLTNSAATAIGTLSLSGASTFRVPSGNGDYYLNRLDMTGGTVDFSGTTNFWLHFVNPGAAITTNASPTTATWIGAGTSRIQNDTAAALQITVNAGSTASGIDLDAGIILSSAGTNPTFQKLGAGTMRLTSLGNTAGIQVYQGSLRVDDMATGGVGALGSGPISLNGGTLLYGGPSATSTKNLTLSNGTIQVLTPGANLQFNGVISESFSFQSLAVSGPGGGGSSSTLTLGQNNSYSGPTMVTGNAVLAIPTIANGGVASPIGFSTVNAINLNLGNSTSRGTLLLTGLNTSTNRGATVNGSYGSGAGGVIGVQDAATNLTVSGPIIGPGSFIKTGAGTLTLTNTANNYTGGAYVEAGTLLIGAPGAVIPANSDVTVFGGAKIQIGFNSGSNNNAPLRTLILDGGTLRVPGGDADYYLSKLVMTGGTVDFSGSNAFYLRMVNNGAAITTNASAATAAWIGDASSRIQNEAGGPISVSVSAGSTSGGIDLDAGIKLVSPDTNSAFVKAGLGTMRLTNLGNFADFVVQQGGLRVDDVLTNGVGTLGSGTLTLNGGRLAYGGATATLSKPFAIDAAGGGLDVLNAGTTLTVTSPVNSNGVLNKSGPGVLVLNNLTNNYAGGIAVSGGRLDVGNDNQLGQAAVTVNPFGTVRFTASTTTARTYTMFNGSMDVPSGVNLTMNGANVAGGFLRGAGTYNLFGGTSLTGVTTFTSTNLNVAGPASASNFSSNGAISVNSGQTFGMNYATNGAAGRITVNGTMNVSDFVSYGQLTVPNGGLINNTGSNMVLGGGSTTFVGSVANPGGKIDLGGQQLIVRSGLLVTNGGSFGSGNGVRNGTTVADYGALVKGTGPYESVITQNGGQYLPGNSPGTSQVGTFNLNGGGGLIFQITDAGPSVTFPSAPGTAGMNPGWGLTQVFTALNFTATPSNPFTITMQTQLPPPAAPDTPGPMSSFDPNQNFSWLIFDLQPGAVFNGTFDPSAISFATSQFVNSTLGGSFSLARNGGQIFLTFTPVPEPEAVLGVALGGLVGAGAFRRLARRRLPDEARA